MLQTHKESLARRLAALFIVQPSAQNSSHGPVMTTEHWCLAMAPALSQQGLRSQPGCGLRARTQKARFSCVNPDLPTNIACQNGFLKPRPAPICKTFDMICTTGSRSARLMLAQKQLFWRNADARRPQVQISPLPTPQQKKPRTFPREQPQDREERFFGWRFCGHHLQVPDCAAWMLGETAPPVSVLHPLLLLVWRRSVHFCSFRWRGLASQFALSPPPHLTPLPKLLCEKPQCETVHLSTSVPSPSSETVHQLLGQLGEDRMRCLPEWIDSCPSSYLMTWGPPASSVFLATDMIRSFFLRENISSFVTSARKLPETREFTSHGFLNNSVTRLRQEGCADRGACHRGRAAGIRTSRWQRKLERSGSARSWSQCNDPNHLVEGESQRRIVLYVTFSVSRVLRKQ